MITRISLVAAALLFALGCGRSPDPTFYTLVAYGGGQTYPASGLVVEVRRPNIAGYLDRREIVQRVAAQQLDVASGALWAEPLATMFERVLASDLAARLPQSQVVTGQAALASHADVTIDIDVQRFEQNAGKLVLEAQLGVRDLAGAKPVLSRVVLMAQPESDSVEGHIAAMNGLTGQLADRVAQAVATAAATPPPSAATPPAATPPSATASAPPPSAAAAAPQPTAAP
jgi:uncharacterized lipoprotein YmbA